MSTTCSEKVPSPTSFLPLPLALVKKPYHPVQLTKITEPSDRRKRLKRSSEEISFENRSEEVLVEVEPDIQIVDEVESRHGQQDSDTESIDVGDGSSMNGDDVPTASDSGDVFTVDEINLSICRRKSGSVYVNCPFCAGVIIYFKIGEHMRSVHKVSRFTCPGFNCPNRIDQVDSYNLHIEKHHFQATCSSCQEHFDPKDYPSHLRQHNNHQPKKLMATILQPRNSNTPGKPSLLKPKPLEVLLGYAVSDNYQILLDGKLVIVDGLYFYNRNGVLFLDCLLCSKAMALNFYGSHISENHDRETVKCPGEGCDKLVDASTIQDHLLSQHTRIRCRTCFKKIELLQVKLHNEICSVGRQSTNPPTAKVASSGLHFLSHFLDHRTQESLPSRSPVDSDRKDDDAISAAASDSNNDSMDGGGGKNSSSGVNNNEQTQKKQRSNKSDKNGKIPTVPCPYCGKQCSYLNKHIRDVHQPKVHCPVCGKRMGKSYLSEHMKIQHQGKEVPTKVCPLCGTRVQKLKNHLKYSHKMSREEADEVYAKFYPTSDRGMATIEATKRKLAEIRERTEPQTSPMDAS